MATIKPRTTSAKPPVERRAGADRRRVDALPVGQRDRRRRVEARKPEVVELDLTEAEWLALSGQTPPEQAQKK
jgi:hypothetical protein